MKLDEIKKYFLNEIENIKDLKTLEDLRVKYLGRKSELTDILRSLKNLSIEEKRKIGPVANNLQKEIEEILNKKNKELKIKTHCLKTKFDVTKPGEKAHRGHIHPLTKIEEEIRHIFLAMNFSVVEGQEIETEYYNFDALNIPANHPARDAWDTFWIKTGIKDEKERKISEETVLNRDQQHHFITPPNKKLLLRTHTSPMQIHYMETHKPPFQIIVPGTTYRYEATDATHNWQFSQMEGLMIGKDISLTNFKYIIETFLKKLFSSDIEFTFRPSYYPFVEPGIDVYMKWKGQWLEVAGSGMVHPEVFRSVGYNPNEWQGFAFGFGLNRLAMIKYKIPDIRLLYSGDLRLIRQF